MVITKSKVIRKRTKIIQKIICDKCGKEILPDDMIEWQEKCSLRFVGGYGSVFGDMNVITCDLCQRCLMDLIGPYYKVERD